ncbi:MAG: hypothetical protein ACRC2B_02715 [Rubrivivax sp.]
MKSLLTASVALAAMWCVGPVSAKLPPPSDEAKAKAAETAAKAAHGGKVEAYLLCKSMDKVAMEYHAAAKKAGTEIKPPTATPPCADPGPFVYAPPVAASAPGAATPAAAPAPAPVTATAAPAAPKK